MACGTRGTTVSEKPADRIFANVPFYYLVQRGTCANFTLASTRRRRMSGKQGFNRNNFIYAGHGVPTEYVPYGPDTARVYLMSQQGGHGVATDRRTMRTGHRAGVLMSQSQFRPSKLRMAPMIKI